MSALYWLLIAVLGAAIALSIYGNFSYKRIKNKYGVSGE